MPSETPIVDAIESEMHDGPAEYAADEYPAPAPKPKRGRKPAKAPRKPTPRDPNLRTVQVHTDYAEQLRELARKLSDTPKIVAAAAISAFSGLDVETQVELLTRVRVDVAAR